MNIGSARQKCCCDRECAYLNGCRIGGVQCEGCGKWYCATELDEFGFCEACGGSDECDEGDEESEVTK